MFEFHYEDFLNELMGHLQGQQLARSLKNLVSADSHLGFLCQENEHDSSIDYHFYIFNETRFIEGEAHFYSEEHSKSSCKLSFTSPLDIRVKSIGLSNFGNVHQGYQYRDIEYTFVFANAREVTFSSSDKYRGIKTQVIEFADALIRAVNPQ